MPANLLISGQVGPSTAGDGAQVTSRFGKSGEQIIQELHGRFYEQAYRGNIYSVSVVTAAAITAYVGAAGGTPMLAVWNPSGSGKNIVPLFASFGNTVAASAAGTASWGLFFGPTAAITQATIVAPTSHQTLQATGSAMTAFRNVALTSSTALANNHMLGAYYWATAAGAALVTPAIQPLEGHLIVPPGTMIALGGSAALTSATWTGSLVWEEVPV